MNRGQADFARVYDEHVWRVYGFLAYRLRDRDVAEDLTQATFERALGPGAGSILAGPRN